MEDLLSELKQLGVTLRLEGDDLRVSSPPGALNEDLRRSLRAHKSEIVQILRSGTSAAPETVTQLVSDAASRFEPFPLTDLQHAYWLGRDSALEMGNVATHLYLELNCAQLDVGRLERALRRLIDRHDMLRAVVESTGTQRVLPSVPPYAIARVDCSTASQAEIDAVIDGVRGELSHQVLKPDVWPLFEVRTTLLPAGDVRLHVSLDLLIFDAYSIFLLMNEWHRVYSSLECDLPSLGLSFRDYVLAERARQGSEAYRRASAYWMERLDRLPPAPELPLRADPIARKSPRFTRRETRIEKALWDGLKSKARARGLTPSGLLMAIYSQVLGRWSGSRHFTLNVTVSNRLPVHPDVHRILGDFTSLTLVEVDGRDPSLSFASFAQRVQTQFLTDLQHNQMSGLRVMQEWNRRHGASLGPTMPVVFSSGLIWTGEEEVGHLELFGTKAYSVSQTSQVWLDHHVMELQGDLNLVWDAAERVFEPDVLDQMFTSYCATIRRLCTDDALWEVPRIVALPDAMAERRATANATRAVVPERRLHEGFVRCALESPDRTAVVSSERTLNYGELLAESCAVADWLLEGGVRAGEPVAIVLDKGWRQIVAVMGALLAGAAYMPIDVDQPRRRQSELLGIGEVRFVLTEPERHAEVLASCACSAFEIRADARGSFGPRHARSLEVPLEQLAYVIFTSGTTGVPKGVMIDHLGATNTIEHVNRLFQVTPDDRVLAVSSLSFDLSVYDVFGLLAAGGALVLPDRMKEHDAVHWRELMLAHRVSLWNSAPQLMRMLMDSLPVGYTSEGKLRTVLLSGDFIPLDLPDRVRSAFLGSELVSLGGATEASIWSNYYRIRNVAPEWSSIPYGKALPNQTLWVYDDAFEPCPDHVRGRIYIGGLGLAKGYWRDAEKTAARFVRHPQSGERLYDTGDLGQYAASGDILILGRADRQVKIRGHRVELGEIESALRAYPGVKQAAVIATGERFTERKLVAYLELSDQAALDPAALDARAVKDHVRERLPTYMVPHHVVMVEAIPLTPNGKLDLRALPSVDELEGEAADLEPPANETEQTILEIWSRFLAGTEIGVTDNFFDLGGDSVVATQLVRELNDTFPGFGLEMHELFETLSIRAIAELYYSRGAHPAAAVGAASEDPALLDVRGVGDRLSGLVFAPPRVNDAGPRAVLVTGATGWIGVHVLYEILAQTNAEVHCLVAGRDADAGRQRILEALRGRSIACEPAWMERVRVIGGDLSEPNFGLAGAGWDELAASVDAVYHAGGSVGLLRDYAAHRGANVSSMESLLRLAGKARDKAVFLISPMTLCRRIVDGQLAVFVDECEHSAADSASDCVHRHSKGLLTPYAQSKWAAETILAQAFERGLAGKIFRTSHALPCSRTGLAKPDDTYMTVLMTACQAKVVPEWEDSALYGVPVDKLARWIVQCSLVNDGYRGVVHLENSSPPSVKRVVKLLLEAKGEHAAAVRHAPLEEWRAACLAVVDALPPEAASLAQVLFTERASGTAVETMFARRPIQTRYFAERGRAEELADVTPADYWQAVYRNARW